MQHPTSGLYFCYVSLTFSPLFKVDYTEQVNTINKMEHSIDEIGFVVYSQLEF